jgi:hypothetical protein
MAETKRRFWQIHLATAIVLMFVAGALLGGNTLLRARTWPPVPVIGDLGDANDNRLLRQEFVAKMNSGVLEMTGFPFVYYYRDTATGIERKLYENVQMNLYAATAILVVTAIGCEWFIRRREPPAATKSPEEQR